MHYTPHSKGITQKDTFCSCPKRLRLRRVLHEQKKEYTWSLGATLFSYFPKESRILWMVKPWWGWNAEKSKSYPVSGVVSLSPQTKVGLPLADSMPVLHRREMSQWNSQWIFPETQCHSCNKPYFEICLWNPTEVTPAFFCYKPES